MEIFFNARGPAIEEHPARANMPIGGTLTLYMEVPGVAKIYEELKTRVKSDMPLEKKFYGVPSLPSRILTRTSLFAKRTA